MVVQSSSHDSSLQAARGGDIWFPNHGLAVKKFRYLGDGLCLICCSLYALNRWYIKPRVHNPFMRFHFNDMLLIPCALPLLLLMQRWLRLRTMDEPPTWGEIALYTVFWSILFEVIGPHLLRRATGDPWDVVVYVVGGIGAGLWWNRKKMFSRWALHEL
jgi:hypothetical protein